MHRVNINEALSLLQAGELVVIPTETVYGLGADATSGAAVERVYRYKNRPADNPLICHFADLAQISEYAEVSPLARALFENFAPGPLTVLLPVKDTRLRAATRGQTKVGCRIPAASTTLELIRRFNRPIAAPSANPSTFPSSTNEEMALAYFAHLSGGVLGGQPARIGLESAIVDLEGDTVTILRAGSIGVAELKKELSKNTKVLLGTRGQATPGQKDRHYSPKTPVYKITALSEFPTDPKAVLLTTKTHAATVTFPVVILAPHYTPSLIAARLYATLLALDKGDYSAAYWYLPELDLANNPSSLEVALQEKLKKILQ